MPSTSGTLSAASARPAGTSARPWPTVFGSQKPKSYMSLTSGANTGAASSQIAPATALMARIPNARPIGKRSSRNACSRHDAPLVSQARRRAMTPFWPSGRHDGPTWAPSSAEASARSVEAHARTTSENASSTGSAAMIAVVRATDHPVTRTTK